LTQITAYYMLISSGGKDHKKPKENSERKGCEMNTIKVQRDGDRNITFKGEKIASAETSANNACGNYSGSVGCWSEWALYKTAKGKYVASKIERSQWLGRHDTHEAAICATPSEVVAFFGQDDLAKEIYDEAGIDNAEIVE